MVQFGAIFGHNLPLRVQGKPLFKGKAPTDNGGMLGV